MGFMEFMHSFTGENLLSKNWEGRNLDMRGKKLFVGLGIINPKKFSSKGKHGVDRQE